MRAFMKIISLVIMAILFTVPVFSAEFEKDIIKTSVGDVEITFIGHASLIIGFKGKIIHVDSWSKLAYYSALPKADIVILTHHHPDHFDSDVIKTISKSKTILVITYECSKKVSGEVIKNGDTKNLQDILIEAVPAYNIVHKRDNGQLFHPKGEGNGYILTFGATRVYIAGDTENTAEMQALKNIDVAFLPMNLPYTMTPAMVADAAKAFKPKVLYPYHYGETDIQELVRLMKDEKDIDLRIRKMK
ncbi:MAG: MBL fold metallo-hydrolase [Desulfamplus sp.]|nr:MBL fold metallo-hydrolase [Desulfamplus sp.]